MMKETPGIKIRLLVADNVRLENLIQERMLDLALIQLPLAFNNCNVLPLPGQHFVACWSPLLPAPPERPATLAEITAFPLLIGRRWANVGAIRPFMGNIQKQGLKPHILLDTPFASTLPDFLLATPAVAIMPLNECLDRKDLEIR